MVKNCDRGLENAARGRRPRAAFSRPRSQFFTIRTSQPANNIYLLDEDKHDIIKFQNRGLSYLPKSKVDFKLENFIW